jgi:hypothetical protein
MDRSYGLFLILVNKKRNFLSFLILCIISVVFVNCLTETPKKYMPFLSLSSSLLAGNSNNSSNTTEYSISGSISGLSGSVLALTLNGSDLISLPSGSINFSFGKKLRSGENYTIGISNYPSGPTQACTINNASGVVSSDSISNVQINCLDGYKISGTVAGLTGTVVLKNNGNDSLNVSANGAFASFLIPLENLASYNIQVNTHPSGQVCYVGQGSGIINSADVTNVEIQCQTGTVPPGPLVGGTIVKELVPQFGHDNPNTGNPYAGNIGSADTTDGLGNTARFNGPYQITTDGLNIYVADRNNHRIRKIRISDGMVSTFAFDGNNIISSPTGITTDGVYVYFASQSRCQIARIKIETGVISILGGVEYDCDIIDFPLDLVLDGSNLYITSWGNHKILKLDINTLIITTIVGTGVPGLSDNAVGTSATINGPRGIIKVGNFLYVSSNGHSIRKIDLTSGTYSISTLAGSTIGAMGSLDGVGTAARFWAPFAISSDGTNLYVADSLNKTIRKIEITSGTVTTLSGCDSAPASSVIGTGNPSISCKGTARYREPSGLTSDGNYLYVADHLDHIIRRIE